MRLVVERDIHVAPSSSSRKPPAKCEASRNNSSQSNSHTNFNSYTNNSIDCSERRASRQQEMPQSGARQKLASARVARRTRRADKKGAPIASQQVEAAERAPSSSTARGAINSITVGANEQWQRRQQQQQEQQQLHHHHRGNSSDGDELIGESAPGPSNTLSFSLALSPPSPPTPQRPQQPAPAHQAARELRAAASGRAVGLRLGALLVGAALLLILGASSRSADAVDCFKCSSRNGSNPACEDPFHNLNTTRVNHPVVPDPPPNVIYHTPCYAGKKGREGLFPASACIKLTGTFDTTGETLVVRHCAMDSGSLTQDTELARMSHCGKFQFEGDLLKGCVLACPEDACNAATTSQLPPTISILGCPLLIGGAQAAALLTATLIQHRLTGQLEG